MPNITITLDEQLYRKARVYAAARRTTVTQLVRKFLSDTVREGFEVEHEELEYFLRNHPAFFRLLNPSPLPQSTVDVRREPDA